MAPTDKDQNRDLERQLAISRHTTTISDPMVRRPQKFHDATRAPLECPAAFLLSYVFLLFFSRCDLGACLWCSVSCTRGVGKLSLNCLFAGRNNNNFDLCRPPGK